MISFLPLSRQLAPFLRYSLRWKRFHNDYLACFSESSLFGSASMAYHADSVEAGFRWD
jgi:hypothetical protein